MRKKTYDDNLFDAGIANLPQVLRQMGFPNLREGQDESVFSSLGGEDHLTIMPTAGGKSACYMIPALCHDWACLVVSPLIALMKDQLREAVEMGLKAAAINSSYSEAQNASALQRWMSGEIQFLYVAPERLINQNFIRAMRRRRPQMIAVDEAHVASEWGDVFRPEYSLIGDAVDAYDPMLVAAFTATCPPNVEDDIRRVLHLGKNMRKVLYFYRRHNLHFHSEKFRGLTQLVKHIREINGPTLVYCATVKKVEELVRQLKELTKLRIGWYHGQMASALKEDNMNRFMEDEVDVQVCTKAFGMGVNKKNIRGVIQYHIPGNIAALAQETGRAGRDLKDSLCYTYYSQEGKGLQEFFMRDSHPTKKDIITVHDTLKRYATKGKLQMTLIDIGQKCGINSSRLVGVCCENMVAAGVIERAPSDPNEPKIFKVKFKVDFDDSRFQNYKKTVKKWGTCDNGVWAFDMKIVAAQVGVSDKTVRGNWMNDWVKRKFISYDAPYAGDTTRLKKDVLTMDFDRLEEKAKIARMDLQQVLAYHRIPNAEKPKYMEEFFLKGHE